MRLTYKAFGTFILKSYRETINGSCNGFRFLNNQRQSIYSAKHSNDLPKRFKISFIMSCLTDKTEISKCMNYHFLLKLQHSQTKKCTQCEFKLKCYIELWAILRYTKLFTIRDSSMLKETGTEDHMLYFSDTGSGQFLVPPAQTYKCNSCNDSELIYLTNSIYINITLTRASSEFV